MAVREGAFHPHFGKKGSVTRVMKRIDGRWDICLLTTRVANAERGFCGLLDNRLCLGTG